MRRLLLLLSIPMLGCLDVSPEGGTTTPPGGGGPPATTVSFFQEVLPLLNGIDQICTGCHGGAGGLSLDSYSAVLTGGVSGPTVDPGNGAGSLIIVRLENQTMPPAGNPTLTSNEIDRIKTWIDEGAQDN